MTARRRDTREGEKGGGGGEGERVAWRGFGGGVDKGCHDLQSMVKTYDLSKAERFTRVETKLIYGSVFTCRALIITLRSRGLLCQVNVHVV